MDNNRKVLEKAKFKPRLLKGVVDKSETHETYTRASHVVMIHPEGHWTHWRPGRKFPYTWNQPDRTLPDFQIVDLEEHLISEGLLK